ncbi:MAG: hypothetical protein DRI48_10930, partial [Chloroflexi bacterium]
MLGRLFLIIAVVAVAGCISACRPSDQEDEGPAIQAAGRRPTYEKVELALELTPDERCEMRYHSESQTTLTLEPNIGNGAEERTVTSSTTTVDMLREVANHESDLSNALKQTSQITSFSMEKVQSEGAETIRRTLIL